MKKIVFVIIILLVTSLLTSCFPYVIRGIDEYSPGNSSVTICEGLLPSKGFIEQFDYINGDYYYYNSNFDINFDIYESALMYFQYDKETYELAKKEIFNVCIFSQENKFMYEGYSFFQHNPYDKNYFPNEFNMIAYNDEICTIVLMGFYTDIISNEREKEIFEFNDFGLFLKEYFWFYDFNSNTPQITD